MPEIDSSIRRRWEKAGGSRIPVSELSPEALRTDLKNFVLSLEGDGYSPLAMDRVESSRVQTRSGTVPVRIYVPAGRLPGTIAYFHGGGWVAGDLDTHDKTCRFIAEVTHTRVVSADYPRAPETRYPALVDTCFDVLRSVAERGPEPDPLLVAGDSAGGHIAALLAQRACETGLQLAGQLLFYPALDLTHALPAMTEHATSLVLYAQDVIAYRGMLLGDDRPETIAEASPIHRDGFHGLPPAVIATAEFDPLRDDGAAYAGLLARDQVPVWFQPHADLIHGWLEWTEVSQSARRARLQAVEAASGLLAQKREKN